MTDKKRPFTKNPVENYYDKNTKRFLKYGRGGEDAAIHREVWGPGVKSRREAIVYVNKLIYETLVEHGALLDKMRVLDLGCGTGGTLFWLYKKLQAEYIGITISQTQVEMAEKCALEKSITNIQFLKGDFLNLPKLHTVNAAFAVESFLHAIDSDNFFQEMSSITGPNGLLIICDDFLSAQKNWSKKRDFWIERFKKGWFANSLLTASSLQKCAENHQLKLVRSQDLSKYLKPYYSRFFLNILKWATRFPIKTPFWSNLAGGTALQVCLLEQWIEYHYFVFKKTD